jgi:dipeptidyl aminopeptidase/acylaminoacyl peptidase
MNPGRALILLVLASAMAGCSSSDDGSTSDSQPEKVTTTTTLAKRESGWSPVAKPANSGTTDVSWFRSKSGQYVAVALPDRPAPFPVVVYYHGAAGLFSPSIDWMPNLARAGYAVVAGCWNTGSPDSVPCPAVTNTPAAERAMYDFATKVSGVDPERVAMMGISAGVDSAVVQRGTSVRAIIADSGSTLVLPDLHAPLLVLGSKRDPRIPRIEAWVARLQRAGETVETHVFENGDHVVTLRADTGQAATADVVRFLDAHLKAAA